MCLHPFTCLSKSTPDVHTLAVQDCNHLTSNTTYEVKKTTKNPIQLPITPIAEYELMNINGKNSNFFPNTS